MCGKVQIVRVPAILAAVVLVFAAPAAAVAPAAFRIATNKEGFPVRLGPLAATSGPHVRDAVAAFGRASSVRPGRGICVARWNGLGLKLLYTSFGGISDFCRDGLLQTAVIRSSRWVTWAGLRVGMRSSRVPELHRNAKFQRGKWVLATQDVFGSEPSPTVSALVRDGRVVALSLFVGRAGD